MRIYKYELEPDRRQIVMMPYDAIPLSVLQQDQKLVMYAQVEQTNELFPRIFSVVTTGDHFEATGKRYIGSCLLGSPEWFVAHVYEQFANFPDPVDVRNLHDFDQIKSELGES